MGVDAGTDGGLTCTATARAPCPTRSGDTHMSTYRHAAPAGSGTAEDRKRRNGAVLKFGLAGLALLGIGAAATSAAWSDDAFFSADANAAKVELTASIDGSHFSHTTSGAPIVIPVGLLNEGATVDRTLTVKNEGTVKVDLSDAVATDGAVFDAPSPATLSVGALSATTLEPGDSATISFLLKTPTSWPTSYQGKTGTITVTVNAQS